MAVAFSTFDTTGEGDRIREALERGETLPSTWYVEPAVLAVEEERIFDCSWQYVGLVSQIPEPGDFLTRQVGRTSVIVVRDKQSNINAFANVCRHRGAELLQGCGHAMALRCPYHAWAYGLDG